MTEGCTASGFRLPPSSEAKVAKGLGLHVVDIFYFAVPPNPKPLGRKCPKRKQRRARSNMSLGRGLAVLVFCFSYCALRYDYKATKDRTSLAAHSPQVHREAQGGWSKFIRSEVYTLSRLLLR